MDEETGRIRARKMYPSPLGDCENCGARRATERHHLDGDTFNNARSNILFVCRPCHGRIDGRWERLKKKHCPKGHAYTPANTYVRSDGAQVCRVCSREIQRRYKARKRG